ncbi:MAG: restriction endonuclease subunit S [Chitinophagales bacterium]
MMAKKKRAKSVYNTSIPTDWEVVELGKLFDFKNGLNKEKEAFGEGTPIVNYNDVYKNNCIESAKLKGKVTLSKSEIQRYDVKKGDVFFTRTSETIEEIGMSSVVIDDPCDTVFSGFILRARPTSKKLDLFYTKYCFSTFQVRKEIIRKSTYTTRALTNGTYLSEVLLLLPPVNEQKAIARLLGFLDTAINKSSSLIAEKELQKKWLMQNLLTAKKRLKGFMGEWEETTLGNLFDRVTRKNTIGNTTVVTISAQRGFVRQTDFFNKPIASEITDNYFLVERGEFCYNKSYSNGYPWGATKRLKDFDKAVVTTLYICFGLKNSQKNSSDYFEQYFDANLLDKGLMKIAHEGGRAHGLLNVTPSDFFSLKITVPNNEEQIAIAKVLQAADKEIQLLKSKTEKLRAKKKGLMQILLTGKKRLTIKN